MQLLYPDNTNFKTRNPLRLLINFFFPGQCVFCDKTLEINSAENICQLCREKIWSEKRRLCCNKCGKPVVSYGKRKICYSCYTTPTKYFDRIVSSFEYDSLVATSVLRYKSAGIQPYAATYAKFIAETVREHYSDISFDFICCAPSHTDKKVKQGFDNVELMSIHLSRMLGIPLEKELLRKIRKTPRQASLKFKERQINLRNSMVVSDSALVKEKTVLLVDDVCTTRATIIECSRALKAAGAKRVYAVTFATTGNNRKMHVPEIPED